MQSDQPNADCTPFELLALINDAVVKSDPAGRIVYLNPAAEALYKVAAAEAVGQPVETLYRAVWLQPQDEPAAAGDLDAAGRWHGEQLHLRSQGEPVHVEVRLTRLRGPDGRVAGEVAAIRDITARKQIEATLHLVDQRFRTGLDIANVAIWTQDPELRVTWAHNPPEPWNDGRIVGRDDAALLPAAQARRVEELKRQVLRSGDGTRYEMFLFTSDGPRWWDVAVEALRDRDGAVTGLICSAPEITRRKNAEAALRMSETRFRSTFENAAVGIGHLSLEGRWLRVNRMLCRILGCSRDELLNREFQDFAHPDDLASSLAQAESLLSGQAGAYCMETRFRHGERLLIWGRLTVSLVRDRRGRPQHFIAVVEDITEQKRAADEIARQRAAFRRLAENSPDIISRFDRQLRHVYVNRAITAVTGLPPAQLIGRTNAELGLVPESGAHWDEALRSVFERAQPLTIDFTFDRGDNRFHFSAVCVPEFGDDGTVESVLSIARDITELRRSAEIARHREGRLNLAIEASRLGVFDWHLTRGEIRCENAIAHDILGLGPDESSISAERFLRDLLHAGAAETFERSLAAAQAAGAVFRHLCLTAPHARRHGRWVEFVGRFETNGGGQPVRLVGFVADITERITAAQRLAAARDAAEAADQAKDRFLAALSHELRTPLTPALMLAEELEHAPDTPEPIRRDCALIRTNIELEARLIDDLLDIARIRHGKLRMTLEPCDAHAVLQRAFTVVKGDFEARQIAVRLSAAGSAPIEADPVRLQQVFWNLFRNAAKFTPVGGRVDITTSLAGGMWRLAVADTGPGLEARELKRIFESFAQVDRDTLPPSNGLGLGLAISSSLVQEHHGRIWAESEGLGHGSTFLVELPLHAAPPPSDSVIAAPAHPIQTLRILVVEDHVPTRDAFTLLLRRRGHRVAGVGSVAEARSAAGTSDYDLVISDLGLPDGDGYALMRQLQRDHGLCGIALSGHGMEADVTRSLESGFLLHLVKPVTFPALEKAVAEVAARL